MDWTAKMNEKLEELGLYPEVEACDIADLAGHIVLVDTQETTVYQSAEGCYRLLAALEPDEDEHDTLDAVGYALHPNLKEAIKVREDAGVWRLDDEAMRLTQEG